MAHYIYVPSQARDAACLIGPFPHEEARHEWTVTHAGWLAERDSYWHVISLVGNTLPIIPPAGTIPSDY